MLEFKQICGIEGFNRAKPVWDEVFGTDVGFIGDAWHIIGYDGDVTIGAARVYRLTDTSFKIDNIAVKEKYRRGFVGDLMIKTLQDKIVTLGGIEAVVITTPAAKGFFTHEGYTEDGTDVMRLDLTKPHRSCTCKKEN